MPLRPAIHLTVLSAVSGVLFGLFASPASGPPSRPDAGWLASLGPRDCQAQSLASTNRGFQVNRFEPTPAGEWSLFVDHPWYSSTRSFAAGLTLNYGHNPLVFGFRDQNGAFILDRSLIAHQLIGHVDVAGSFLDRFLVAASLPVTLLERGNSPDGDYGVNRVTSAAVGDPRLSLRSRLIGQPYRQPFSFHAGIDVWLPLANATAAFPAQVGDTGLRVQLKLIVGGLWRTLLWSFSGSYLYRAQQSLGTLPPGSGNSVGPSLQLAGAIAYARRDLGLALGPEFLLSTVLSEGAPFRQDYTSLEILGGLHYSLARRVQLSLGGGLGLLREPGTPDGRVLLRLAYAPLPAEKPKDRDGDGIPDRSDACPDVAGVSASDPKKHGCPPPPPDRDGDGLIDRDDACPTEPPGNNPDPRRPGCPRPDSDRDGLFDDEDQCPSEPAGDHPDTSKLGCPLRDQDQDGIWDPQDACLDVPAGAHPDPQKPGCPDRDSDGDGVYDAQDQCRELRAGMFPDPQKPGCPLSDRDHDLVPDASDACPDKPGAPATDPKKNGCPGLVEAKADLLVIRQQVFYAPQKDTILKKSFKVLDAVVAALKATPQIKRVAVEGHTDNVGKPEQNRDLSARRATSVMGYLVGRGVEPARLEAHGYGPDRPIADNKKPKGRALNRRTDFRILDPAIQDLSPSPPPAAAAPSPATTQSPPASPAGTQNNVAGPAAGPAPSPAATPAGSPAPGDPPKKAPAPTGGKAPKALKAAKATAAKPGAPPRPRPAGKVAPPAKQ